MRLHLTTRHFRPSPLHWSSSRRTQRCCFRCKCSSSRYVYSSAPTTELRITYSKMIKKRLKDAHNSFWSFASVNNIPPGLHVAKSPCQLQSLTTTTMLSFIHRMRFVELPPSWFSNFVDHAQLSLSIHSPMVLLLATSLTLSMSALVAVSMQSILLACMAFGLVQHIPFRTSILLLLLQHRPCPHHRIFEPFIPMTSSLMISSQLSILRNQTQWLSDKSFMSIAMPTNSHFTITTPIQS